MSTTRPDGSEIPRGSGALASLTPERTPTASDFVLDASGRSMTDAAESLTPKLQASFATMAQPPAASDVIPAMLTPGEVVLTEQQQRDVAEQAGQSPASLFANAKVPGFIASAGQSPAAKPKTARERFTRAIGEAAEVFGFSRGGKVPFNTGPARQFIRGAFTDHPQIIEKLAEKGYYQPDSVTAVDFEREHPDWKKTGKRNARFYPPVELQRNKEERISQPFEDHSSEPVGYRYPTIRAGIETEGGILLSEALPLLNDDTSEKVGKVPESSEKVAQPTPAKTSKWDRLAKMSVSNETPAQTPPEPPAVNPTMPPRKPPKTRGQGIIDTLADALVGRNRKSPKTQPISMPIGAAATFPRDVPPKAERTGLVDPHPGPLPLPKGLNVAGMKWGDMPREVQALIAKQQPELAQQLQQAPLQDISEQIADMRQRAAKLGDDAHDSGPTYSLAKPKTRAQRVDEERSSVVAALLSENRAKPALNPPETYKLQSPDLMPASPSHDSPRPASQGESGPIGRQASNQPGEMADIIHAVSRMIGGRTGRVVGMAAQMMGAKPYSREPLGSRLGRYLTGGGSGGPPVGPNSRGTSSGDEPEGDGGGRFGDSITGGLSSRMSSGGVIHVWVDGGQIEVDDAAGGAGPSGGDMPGVHATHPASTTAMSHATPMPTVSPVQGTFASQTFAKKGGLRRRYRAIKAAFTRASRFSNGSGGKPGASTFAMARKASGNLGGGLGGLAGGNGVVSKVVGVAVGAMTGNPVLGYIAAQFTAVVTSTVSAMGEFAKSINESNRSLAMYNGRLSVAFGMLEMHRTMRNLATANATSESGAALAGAVNRLENAEQPGRIAVKNLQNEAGIAGAEGGRMLAEMTRIADEIGVFKMGEKGFEGLATGLGAVADAVSTIGDSVVYLKEWFSGEPHREKDKVKLNENELPRQIAFASAMAGTDPWKNPFMIEIQKEQNKRQRGGRNEVQPLGVVGVVGAGGWQPPMAPM